MSMCEELDAFRRTYAARPPMIVASAGQRLRIGPTDGRRELDGTAGACLVVELPLADGDVSEGRCLWVILPDGVPYAREVCEFARRHGLAGDAIKHTNLTGGADAHCGGELWFVGERMLLVNGYSGRYGPKSPQELEDAAKALRGCGYEVGFLPWDDEVGKFPIAPAGKDDVTWL